MRCQVANGRPWPIRFRSTNTTTPTPISRRAPELGSGVATDLGVATALKSTDPVPPGLPNPPSAYDGPASNVPMVMSSITKYQLVEVEPTSHVYVSVEVSAAFSVMVNVWEKNATGMIGEGNDTGGSVGTDTQEPAHVKLASNESARALGAPIAANSKAIIHNDFRIPNPHERCD